MAKVVMLGDGCVGKTRLIDIYFNREEDDRLPFREDSVHHDNDEVLIFDMKGQEEYNFLRSKEYVKANAFILVYSVAKPSSIENLAPCWKRQLEQMKVTNVPILIIGVDIDFRDSKKCISKEQAQQLIKKEFANFGKVEYQECAFSETNTIITIFHQAFDMALEHSRKNNNEKSLSSTPYESFPLKSTNPPQQFGLRKEVIYKLGEYLNDDDPKKNYTL